MSKALVTELDPLAGIVASLAAAWFRRGFVDVDWSLTDYVIAITL
ncbi:hypothetical protein [Brevibacterium marinum]|uniref:Uncharacterized protein n=1 Tax=Brevibacterium marinum TaxID=418643 RepID=A0A846RY97_9MICO|nr:hypothetical protein [Brevibacterium marinum]NJC56110.1 hypothetical protein [Brevibacterium marinum]